MKSSSIFQYLNFNNVLFVLFLALMPSFFLHHRINGFITMLIIIVGLIQFTVGFKSVEWKGFILLMPILFLILVFGQFYSNDVKTGWTLVERSLSLLLIPFALSHSSQLTVNNQKMMIHFFVVIGFFASLYCLSNQGFQAAQAGSIYASEESTHFLFNRFMHHRLSAPLKMHAVYFSLFIAFLAIFILHILLDFSQSRINKAGLTALFVFFGLMLILLKSAIIVIGFSIVVLYFLFKKGATVSDFKHKIVFSGLAVTVVILAIYAIVSKVEFINLNYHMADLHMGMVAIRLSIWENALSIIGSNWFFGVGTGDADLALRNQFLNSGFTIGYKNDYNCHNMYLQYWLGNGILAAAAFIIYLILLLKKAFKYQNKVFIGFVILFAVFSITESTMRVQKGLVFFMVISSLFYWNPNLWSNQPAETK